MLSIYTGILVSIIFFGFLYEEKDKNKYFYIVSLIMFAVLFFRTPSVGGDLGRYLTHFNNVGVRPVAQIVESYDDNLGFYIYTHYIYVLFHGNYQAYISVTAMFTILPQLWLFKKYSKSSYLSFMTYFCFGYYLFLFSGLKQSLAMAILCYAYHYSHQRKFIPFVLCVLLASSFHFPAIVFLPAYFLMNKSFNGMQLSIIGFSSVLIYVGKSFIVRNVSLWYESALEETERSDLGGKVVLILLIIICGYLLITPNNSDNADNENAPLFKMMCMAMILQIFAVFGNVFERLADYYFVYIALYIPEMMYGDSKYSIVKNQSPRALSMCASAILVIYYIIYGGNAPIYRTWLFN